MSAVDQMREMINQLMGTDPSIDDGRERLPFTDVRICRNFLLGCCPHDILASTRMDMGECQKIHDVALRADFERSQKDKDHFYDLDAFEVLERFFYDCDRKMDIAKKKLAETQEELSQEATEKAEKVLELNENIGKTLAEAEKLGNEGRVEESLALMEKLDTLKKEKQDADQEYRNAMPASSYQQQKLRVCEVCSAYLGIHDNDRRLADHFGGKLHVGFVFLRDRLAELKTNVEQRRAAKEAARRGSYGADRDKDKDRGKGRDYYDRRRSRSPRDRGDRPRDRNDRDRERDRDRDRGDRDKDKDRDRSGRHRDPKDSRERDRDRGDRDKDRDRRGDRDRDRGDRDRDRDRRRDRDRGSDKDRRASKHSRRSRSKSRDRSTGESSKSRTDPPPPEEPKEPKEEKVERPSPPPEPSGEPSPGEIRSENGDSKKEHFSDVDD